MEKHKLETLNLSVLKALDFFKANRPVALDLKKYSFPIVVGSGNAINAGLAMFSGRKAIFANESNFRRQLKDYRSLIAHKDITHAVVISASGEKDSVWEIKATKKVGLKTVLLTCSPESTAAKLADESHFFRKLAEPYTYNVSTYLGMLIASSKEKPGDIAASILKLKLPFNFKKYRAYSFIVPDEFGSIAPMLEIKRNELFGPNVSLRACTFGEARHAKFVVREKDELVISFGKNEYFGHQKSRLEINVPRSAGIAWMMSVGYFLIGLIQDGKPDYFGKHIKNFCTDYGYKAYEGSKPFPVIVPGN
ncbi:MAG: hypothetical protein ACM3PZ_00765 [Bacillota bacterium]